MTTAFEPRWKQSTGVSWNSFQNATAELKERKKGLTDVFNGREVVCQFLPGVHVR